MLVCTGALIKHLYQEVPLVQIIFFRNLFALVVLIPFLFRLGFSSLRTNQLGMHFQRGLFGVTATSLMFYTFANLRLTEAVLIKATTPIMLSFMAWMVLRERLPKLGWCAIFLAFLGVAVVMQPTKVHGVVSLSFYAGVAAALFAAWAKILVRRLGRSEPTEVIVFYFAAFASLVTLPFLIFEWHSGTPEQWLGMVLVAVFATFGQLCITKAYTVARAGRVAIFTYLSLPIAGLLGWFLWSEVIDLPLIIGTLIIVSAGALSVYAGRGYSR